VKFIFYIAVIIIVIKIDLYNFFAYVT